MARTMTESRMKYRRSGRARWLLLLLWTVPVAWLALLMARWLNVAYLRGFYFMILTPFFLTAPVAAIVYLAVWTSHCRNWPVATGLGFLAGGVVFFGHFYFSMVGLWGPAAAGRLELLPRFIAWRVRTDVEVDLDEHGRRPAGRGNVRQPRPRPALTALSYFLDFFAAITLPTVAGALVARRAYCESCRRWMRRRKVKLPLGLGPRIAEALAQGTLETLPEILLDRKPDKRHARLTVEYCAGSGQPVRCGVYLTLSRHGPEGPGEDWVEQVRLTREELSTLAGVVPPVRSVAKEMIDREAAPPPAPEPAEALGDVTAMVRPAPKREGSDPFSLRNRILRRLLASTPVVGALAGFVAAMAALYMYVLTAKVNPQILPLARELALGGVAAFLVFGLWVANNNEALANRLARRGAQRVIQPRADPLVDLDDPDAVFVEVVPRERWKGLFLDWASDAGFLSVDPKGRMVLLEGVCQRYRIPAEAIRYCAVETMDTALDQFSNYAVVVRADESERHDPESRPVSAWTQWEAPLVPRLTALWAGKKARRRAADDLCRRIGLLMQLPPDEDRLA